MPLRPVNPESAAAVRPHLQPATAPHPGGMLVDSYSFAPNKYGPTFTKEWFSVGTPLRGRAENLGRGTVGLVAAGWFEDDLVGKMKLGRADFMYAVPVEEISSLLTDQDRPSPLHVASAGVLRYLEGYDPEEDANLRAAIGAVIEQEQTDLRRAVRLMLSDEFVPAN